MRSVAERFWSKVDKSGPVPTHRPELGPCWVWTRSCTSKGYGKFRLGADVIGAHRASWELTTGRAPDSLHVLHKCDNPACVRPDHLFLGDQAANASDMVSKNRQASGDRSGARRCPDRLSRGDEHYTRVDPTRVSRGEGHPLAKLSASIVREVRARYLAGESQVALAAELGLTRSALQSAISGRTWKHVA